MLARESGANGRVVREREIMVVEGSSCEKYLILVSREFHRLREELRKERPENLNLEVGYRKEKQICQKNEFYQCV